MSAPTPATAPWKLPATTSRLIDGDTAVFKVTLKVSLPEEAVTVERGFVVRLLEVNTPEPNEPGGKEATAFARSFLFEDGDLAVPRPVQLGLTGRKDVYGRMLGWAVVEGKNLSSELVAAGLGEYRALAAHVAALTEQETA